MESFWFKDLYCQGIDLYLTDSHIGNSVRGSRDKTFEPNVKNWIANHLSPDWSFVDIGAHIGLFSTYAMKLTGEGGMVLAVEPRRDVCDLLRYNLSVQMPPKANYRTFRGACWDKKARLPLYKDASNNDGDNRITHCPEAPADGWAVTETECVTLDWLTLARHPEVADRNVFLKIDAQWAEVEVLEGGKKFLPMVAAGIVEVQVETRERVHEILTGAEFVVTDLGEDLGFSR